MDAVTWKNIKKVKRSIMAETLILGNDYTITTDSNITQLNNNILVVGPSGSGKTMSYAEMCLLKTNSSSLIVTLSKRKLVHKYTFTSAL